MLIAPAAMAQMLADAARTDPLECCGLLLGLGENVLTIQAAANIAEDPARHFEIDPQALVDGHRAARAGGPQVLGYYHSHPAGPARPSATDSAMAAGDGRIWAIIGAPNDAPTGAPRDVTFWRDGEQGFEVLSYRLA